MNLDYRQRVAELYHLCSRQSATARDALPQALSASQPLVRHVAAIELAKLQPELVPEKSIREMLDTLAKNENLERLPIEDEYSEADRHRGGQQMPGPGNRNRFCIASLWPSRFCYPAAARILEFR